MFTIFSIPFIFIFFIIKRIKNKYDKLKKGVSILLNQLPYTLHINYIISNY